MKKRNLIIISISLILSAVGLSQVYRVKTNDNDKKSTERRVNIKKNKDNVVKYDQAIIQDNLTGTWYWKSDNGKNNIELYLIQNGTLVTGKHCGSFYEGSKIDCISEDDENSITLTQISSNVFEGNLISGYSDITIQIRITLNPSNETIFFQQLSQPTGEYYLPNNVMMTLAQE
jgi:hypothetical protein